MIYKTEFRSVIRRPHVYKITWFSVINEKLGFKKNDPEKALSYDKHNVEVYLNNGTLVSHTNWTV